MRRKDVTMLPEFKAIVQLAEDGDVTAQLGLGTLYFVGIGVKKDNAKAEEWLLMAANRGMVEAQYFLGILMEK